MKKWFMRQRSVKRRNNIVQTRLKFLTLRKRVQSQCLMWESEWTGGEKKNNTSVWEQSRIGGREQSKKKNKKKIYTTSKKHQKNINVLQANISVITIATKPRDQQTKLLQRPGDCTSLSCASTPINCSKLNNVAQPKIPFRIQIGINISLHVIEWRSTSFISMRITVTTANKKRQQPIQPNKITVAPAPLSLLRCAILIPCTTSITINEHTLTPRRCNGVKIRNLKKIFTKK